MKAEQTALVTSLRGDLKNALDETEACRKRSRELEEFKGECMSLLLLLCRVPVILWEIDCGHRTRLPNKTRPFFTFPFWVLTCPCRVICIAVKAEGQLLKMAALAEQVQGLQSAVEDKDSLITRMRSEQQVRV